MYFGILGYGKIGKTRRQSLENEGATLRAVFDPLATDIPADAARETPEAVCNDPDIEVIVVAGVNRDNAQYTKMALEAGKHVFCEKPPALTAAQVREIQQVEQKIGKILMYGFNHRQHGAVKKMKELVDSGDFGRVLWMRGRYGKSVDEEFFSTWRADKELSGGGILIDQGIHMLDLFLHMGGSFDDVHAFVSNLYWKLDGIEDNVFAIMKNSENGLVASLHSTMTQWRHLFSLEVFLESGYMVLNGLRTSSKTYGEEVLSVARNRTQAPAATWEDEERFAFDVDGSMEAEVGMFLDAIKSGRRPLSGNSDDALAVMELVDAIYKNDTDARNGLYSTLKPRN